MMGKKFNSIFVLLFSRIIIKFLFFVFLVILFWILYHLFGFVFSIFFFFWFSKVLSHLVNLVAAWRAGCHERWDGFAPAHVPPRLVPEPPRWPPVEPEVPPDDWCCHGAQRLDHAPWFHGHDQPPVIYFLFVWFFYPEESGHLSDLWVFDFFFFGFWFSKINDFNIFYISIVNQGQPIFRRIQIFTHIFGDLLFFHKNFFLIWIHTFMTTIYKKLWFLGRDIFFF